VAGYAEAPIKTLAFTVIETLVVIVIVSVLASLAMVTYGKTIERQRAKHAETSLMAIYHAEKRYKLDQQSYFVCSGSGCLPILNDALGLELDETYFSYQVTSTGGGFLATATRTEGACQGQQMWVDESTSKAQKGNCPLW
jgi:Tfp pilus assembly protein PilE